MIRINLLPDDFKTTEGSGMPKMLGLLVGLGVNAVLALAFVYFMSQAKAADERLETANGKLSEAEAAEKAYNDKQKEVDSMALWGTTCAELANNGPREIAPLLDTLLDLVPMDVWISKLQLTAEEPPKNPKKDPPTQGMLIFTCNAWDDGTDSINNTTGWLSGAIYKNPAQVERLSPEQKSQFHYYLMDVDDGKVDQPATAKWTYLPSGTTMATWTQRVFLKLRGNYGKK